MIEKERQDIINKISDTMVLAGSAFSRDKCAVYQKSISEEKNETAKWALNEILKNAEIARDKKSPLCDDTGIPHIIIEAGKNRSISGEFMDAVYEGIRVGLKKLPGRPMAIKGSDRERIDQSGGLDSRSEAVDPAPIMLKSSSEDDKLSVIILMQGGGPEIRAKTYRVFHKHSMYAVINEVIKWASEVLGQLGCSPCTLAVGIGRSHYEASSMMLLAMAEGDYSKQSEYERRITDELNKSGVGAIGLGGDVSVLGTFLKVGPQRASGVRIVSMRPCCCFEPRKARVEF